MFKIKDKYSLNIHFVLFAALLSIIVIILVVYMTYEKKEKPYDSSDQAMNTYVRQTVYGSNAKSASENAVSEINNLEKLLSYKIEGSDIYKINNMAGKEWVDIHKSTMDVLSFSLDVAKKSAGAFEPTILPVSKIWLNSKNKNIQPSENEITNAMKYVGYENIRLNLDVQRAKLMKEGYGIDLSAALHGTACDLAVKSYEKNSVSAGIVSVGESIGVYGTKGNNSPWRIAIRDPNKGIDEPESMAILKINKGFVSTTGINESKFNINGNVYNNIINPQTGYPVDGDLIAVTVYHQNGTMADLLSTACFINDREKSKYLLDYYGAGAVFVYKDKTTYVTDNIKKNFVVTNEEYTLCDWT